MGSDAQTVATVPGNPWLRFKQAIANRWWATTTFDRLLFAGVTVVLATEALGVSLFTRTVSSSSWSLLVIAVMWVVLTRIAWGVCVPKVKYE